MATKPLKKEIGQSTVMVDGSVFYLQIQQQCTFEYQLQRSNGRREVGSLLCCFLLVGFPVENRFLNWMIPHSESLT